MRQKILKDIVTELQHVPAPLERIDRAATVVEENNERISSASGYMLEFDDNPGDFLAWLLREAR
jgi:hypothetical protein